jgi:hypothetical protein
MAASNRRHRRGCVKAKPKKKKKRSSCCKKQKQQKLRRQGGVIGQVVKGAKKLYDVAIKPGMKGYKTHSTIKKLGEGDTVGLIREGVSSAVTKFAPILGIASIAGALTNWIKKKPASYPRPILKGKWVQSWKNGISTWRHTGSTW